MDSVCCIIDIFFGLYSSISFLLVTVALECVMIPGSLNSPTLHFSCRITLVILNPLHSQINFRIFYFFKLSSWNTDTLLNLYCILIVKFLYFFFIFCKLSFISLEKFSSVHKFNYEMVIHFVKFLLKWFGFLFFVLISGLL